MIWCSLSFRCFLCQSLSLLSKSYCSFSWAKWDKTKTTLLILLEDVICKILRYSSAAVDSWDFITVFCSCHVFSFNVTWSSNFTQKNRSNNCPHPDDARNCTNSKYFPPQQTTSGILTQENKHKRLDRMKRFFIASFYGHRRWIRWKNLKAQQSGSVWSGKVKTKSSNTSKAIETDSIKTFSRENRAIFWIEIFCYHFELSLKMQTAQTIFIK